MLTLALGLLVAVLAVAVALLATAIWSLTHVRHGKWEKLEPQEQWDEHFPHMIAGLCLSSLTEGNAFRLLNNGDEFWEELRRTAAAAQHTIHFETFLWKTGQLSATLVDVLCERAAAGVTVRMVIDAEGGVDMREPERQRLRDCGVHLYFFRRRRLRNLGTFNGRDHRKLALVDSRFAFVGGHCVTDEWTGDAQDREHYRDVSVKVEGPVVTHLQSAFSENWTEVTGQLLLGRRMYEPQPAAGSARAHVAYVTFERRISTVKTLYMMAILSAKRQILIQNPYFLPDRRAADALCRAVERGVRVRVMTPTFASTDNRMVLHAMRNGLAPMLRAGVEVYGYDRTLCHQKLATVDGQWSIIGSTNFDLRSFEINEEISLSIFDADFARELEQGFERDLAYCHPYTLQEVERRTLRDQVLDRLSWLVREQL